MPFLRENPDVLRGFRAGDQEALKETYWAYARAVEAVARRVLQRWGRVRDDELLDVVQETFLRAFSPSARRVYDGVRDYGPYLNVTARNVATRWMEKRSRERPTDADSLVAALPAGDVATETDLWNDPQVLLTLQHYLEGLPAQLRQVHEFRYVAALSQRDAAEKLGVSRQQLRTLERRLQEGLRERLEMAAEVLGVEDLSDVQPKRSLPGSSSR